MLLISCALTGSCTTELESADELESPAQVSAEISMNKQINKVK